MRCRDDETWDCGNANRTGQLKSLRWLHIGAPGVRALQKRMSGKVAWATRL